MMTMHNDCHPVFQTMTNPTAVGTGATSQEPQAGENKTERGGNKTPVRESMQEPTDEVLLKR